MLLCDIIGKAYHMTDGRDEILKQLWDAQDVAYDLMAEYDSMPHIYGSQILYQAEGYMLHMIALYPGSTITEISTIMQKTTSACSQIVRKLRTKGLVKQVRNPDNNRKFNLWLTDAGSEVHKGYLDFNEYCQTKTFDLLKDISAEELAIHTKVQCILNEAYRGDIRHCLETLSPEQTDYTLDDSETYD